MKHVTILKIAVALQILLIAGKLSGTISIHWMLITAPALLLMVLVFIIAIIMEQIADVDLEEYRLGQMEESQKQQP